MDVSETRIEELRRQLLKIVIEEGLTKSRDIRLDEKLADAGIESADFVMILMQIEEQFGIYLPVDERLTEAKTVGDLIDRVIEQILEHEPEPGL